MHVAPDAVARSDRKALAAALHGAVAERFDALEGGPGAPADRAAAALRAAEEALA